MQRLKPSVTGTVLIVIAWGALSFGAVYPWAYAALLTAAAGVGIAGLLAGRRPFDEAVGSVGGSGAKGARMPGVERALALSLAALVLTTALQLVPLPAAAVAAVNPVAQRFEARVDVVPTPLQADDATGAPPLQPTSTHRLSIDPRATLRGLAFLVAFSVFLLGLATSLARTGAAGLTQGIVVIGVLVAMVAIVQQPLFAGEIYGFWRPQTGRGAFGPFVNANHFAGWMVMALALSMGHFCGRVARGLRGVKPDWRSRFLWLSSREANVLVLGGVSLVVMALSLVLALSRSGITCLALALILGAGMVARRLVGGSRRVLASAYLAFVLVVAVGWAGVDAVSREFASASWNTFGGRLGAWQDAMRVIEAFPMAGTGLNTYGTAMVVYQTFEVELNHFREAHNDYLQFAAEGGLLLGIPALAALFAVARAIRRRFREPSDETTYWLRVGAVIGISAIALQEVVDFSLQIPGNALLFCVLVAIAVHRAPFEADRRHGARAPSG